VAPDDPGNLPPLRRPPILGGSGKDPAREIDTYDLGPDLQFRPDPDNTGHGFIEPARPMALAEYEQALAVTREKWVRHTG
jgi:hypothetical protein